MKRRIGIRYKITLFTSICMILVIAIGMTIGYFWAVRLMRNVVGKDYEKMAYELAKFTGNLLLEELKDTKIYADTSLWRNTLLEKNLKYKNMTKEDMRRYFSDMDRIWKDLPEGDSRIQEYLKNPLAEKLARLAEAEQIIAEIFVTDKFGGLVASSQRTSDFYQADEKWWQKAFVGQPYMGDIAFDESSNAWSIAIAVPVKNNSGDVIGVCKNVLNISSVLMPLERFKIGKTGHALIVNREGDILFHGTGPSSIKLSDKKTVEKLLAKETTWTVTKTPQRHKGDIFVASAKFSNPFFIKQGLEWFICVEQEAKEVFVPIKTLILQAGLLTPILILTVIPLGFIFGGILSKPIRKLNLAAKRIQSGDADYEVDIKTGDEFEDLADSLTTMVAKLREEGSEIYIAKQKFERLSQAMEEKVEERTKELNQTQEATLNMLEDLSAAKEEIAEKETLFHTTVAGLPVSIFVLNSAAIFMLSEGQGLEKLDMFPENVLGKSAYEHFRNMPKVVSNIRHAFEGSEGEFIQETDGITLQIHISPVKDEKDHVVHVIGLAIDVTERRKAQERIEGEHERLQAILQSAPLGVYVVNQKGKVDYVNPTMLEIAGDNYEQFKSLNVFELPTYKKLGLDKKIKAAFQNNSFILENVEYTSFYSKKKTVRNFVGMPLEDEGEVKALIFVEDISERRKADKLKDEFISTVSHELRTPLSITREGISLVLDRIPGKINEKQEKILDTSRSNIDRLARLINDLLDISKIEAGRFELKKRLVNLNTLIEEAVFFFKDRASEKKLVLKMSLPKKEVDLYIDPERITQVLTNLLDNALKFTEKGCVEVSVREKDDVVECAVTNTGPVITKENLATIFDKFKQFGRVEGAGEKGTGLGLSITKKIIDMHKGRIRAESTSGKNTAFIFALPKYTESQIFATHVEEKIKEARKNDIKMSLVVVSLTKFDKVRRGFGEKEFYSIMKGMEEAVTASLRPPRDVTFEKNGFILALLSNCDKKGALTVRERLREALDGYLAGRKLIKKINLHFGSVTYPDDARESLSLIEKARKA